MSELAFKVDHQAAPTVTEFPVPLRSRGVVERIEIDGQPGKRIVRPMNHRGHGPGSTTGQFGLATGVFGAPCADGAWPLRRQMSCPGRALRVTSPPVRDVVPVDDAQLGWCIGAPHRRRGEGDEGDGATGFKALPDSAAGDRLGIALVERGAAWAQIEAGRLTARQLPAPGAFVHEQARTDTPERRRTRLGGPGLPRGGHGGREVPLGRRGRTGTSRLALGLPHPGRGLQQRCNTRQGGGIGDPLRKTLSEP